MPRVRVNRQRAVRAFIGFRRKYRVKIATFDDDYFVANRELLAFRALVSYNNTLVLIYYTSSLLRLRPVLLQRVGTAVYYNTIVGIEYRVSVNVYTRNAKMHITCYIIIYYNTLCTSRCTIQTNPVRCI